MRSAKNPNTPALWDKLLFDNNNILLRSPFYIDKIKYVIKILKKYKGNFLDVGFGAGNLEKEIIKKNLDLKIYGIDISTKAVKAAKKELRGNFFTSDIFKLPFKSSSFEVVTILDVLEHIYEKDTARALKEINRVLKKGGGLIVSVPLNENLSLLNKEGKNFNRHVREYTFEILTKELTASGFKTIDRKFIYGFPKFYFIKTMIVNLLPGLRKPNLLLVLCIKK